MSPETQNLMNEQDIPVEAIQTTEPDGSKGSLRQALGYVIALVCLVWVFHDIHPERILGQIGNISWGWVALWLLGDFFTYVTQGYRWHLLLRPTGKVSTVRTTQAIYSGLFTNEILPFRTGELIRAYLVSHWMRASFVGVIPSIMVERFFDALWLGVGIALTAQLVDLPSNLMWAANVLGVVVLFFIAVFAFLVIRKEKELEKRQTAEAAKSKLMGVIGSTLNRLAAGIKTIGTSRSFYAALLVSPFFLIFQALALWFIMIGYGLHLSVWSGAAVMMILLLGTAIPNAPSNVGTYQFFTVLGLTLFGIDKTTATGFSVVAFIVLTLPLWIIGFIALTRTGMKLRDIQFKISKLMKRKT